jgi:cobalt/nickel transport system permease protein
MARIDAASLDITHLDRLALGNTFLHCLDPRAKVMVTAAFILSVVSFGKYQVSALVPFALFPALMMAQGNIPLSVILRKALFVLPFAVTIGIFNPIFDRDVLLKLGTLEISAGWISCASIVVRSLLTVAAAITLVAVTGFPAVCWALERLGMPRTFAMQLLFLYRYLFVLVEEGRNASRARELRSVGKKSMGMATFGSLVGHLLLRTWERAERIYMAMLARGFTGEFHARREFRFTGRDWLFLFGWSALFIIMRYWNVSRIFGNFITGSLS